MCHILAVVLQKHSYMIKVNVKIRRISCNKPTDGQTDRQTDKQSDPMYPTHPSYCGQGGIVPAHDWMLWRYWWVHPVIWRWFFMFSALCVSMQVINYTTALSVIFVPKCCGVPGPFWYRPDAISIPARIWCGFHNSPTVNANSTCTSNVPESEIDIPADVTSGLYDTFVYIHYNNDVTGINPMPVSTDKRCAVLNVSMLCSDTTLDTISYLNTRRTKCPRKKYVHCWFECQEYTLQVLWNTLYFNGNHIHVFGIAETKTGTSFTDTHVEMFLKYTDTCLAQDSLVVPFWRPLAWSNNPLWATW